MPPKALVGSVWKALPYACSALAPTATPQGLACLTMTQAGVAASKLLTHSQAASASAMLL